MIQDLIGSLQDHSSQLQTIIEHLSSYDLDQDISEDLNERLGNIQEEIDNQIYNFTNDDWLEFIDAKELAQLGHFGTPNQQDWGEEFFEEYESLQRIKDNLDK